MIAKDVGFVTRRFNFRDTSVIITAYTERHGKINGLLKGFYTLKKEFASPLDVFTMNEFIFYPRTSELWLISHADLINDYGFLRNDIGKNILASSMLTIINKASVLHDKNSEVFRLLKDSFEYLATADDKKLLYIFIIKFLAVSGFKPEFGRCTRCSVQCSGEVFFTTLGGGLLCSKCRYSTADAERISLQTSSTIRYIQRNHFPHLLRINPSEQCETEIIHIVKKFIAHYLTIDPFMLLYRNSCA